MKLTNSMQNALFLAATAGANYSGLFDSWKGTATGVIQSIISSLVVPIGIGVVIVFLLIEIIKCVNLKKRGQGEEISDHIMMIVVYVALIAVLASYYAWSPMLWNTNA